MSSAAVAEVDPSARLTSPDLAAAVALFGSGALLLGALGFQYLAGYPPCSLCYWQRYGHIAVLLLAWLALLPLGRGGQLALLALAGVALFATAGIAIYHVGVEWKWWAGPASCTTASMTGLSIEETLRALRRRPVVPCDTVVWSLLGLSMAGWNAVLSGALGAAVLAMAWRRASSEVRA
ncbi:MAG TPA: disulfide bond formation protein B [Vineibacter sp.]|nr:disulfide bond formation protein B [Vineibacter sp.]